jgi:hypothetical protein
MTFEQIASLTRPDKAKGLCEQRFIRILVLQEEPTMLFWAQCGVMWVDLSKSTFFDHYIYRSRRHLMRLHCRYDQISPVWQKSCIRILVFQEEHAMLFWAQPGVIWLDIVMSKHYRHSLRSQLMKLHPRNDQTSVVWSTMQVSFLYCDDDIHENWTEEYVRRSSHELMHSVDIDGDWVIPVITNVTAALSVRRTGMITTFQVPAEVPWFHYNVAHTGLWPYLVVSVMQSY